MMDRWFTTEPVFEDELPLGTRIQVNAPNYLKHMYHGKTGVVVGYRSYPGMVIATGWHYIRFDDDTEVYPEPKDMPYVHRQYLEVIE